MHKCHRGAGNDELMMMTWIWTDRCVEAQTVFPFLTRAHQSQEVDVPAGIYDVRGPLNEYVVMEGPRQTIRNDFYHFLTSFVDENGDSVYGARIKAMCEGNIILKTLTSNYFDNNTDQ